MKKIGLFLLFLCTAGVSKAATFRDLNLIARDQIFEGRVVYALEVASIAVLNESTTTANHVMRANFAKQAVQGGINPYLVSLGVLTNATIASEADSSALPDFSVPDGDIQFTVNSLFSSFAGISN